MRSPVIERLMVRGSRVAIKHVIHDMVTRTLLMELRRRAIKRWVPCDDMDRRLKIPHSAKVECGFRTTPEECLYDSGLIGHQYRASLYNTIQYNTRKGALISLDELDIGGFIPSHHWLRVAYRPHISGTCHQEAGTPARERGHHTPCLLSFGLRIMRA